MKTLILIAVAFCGGMLVKQRVLQGKADRCVEVGQITYPRPAAHAQRRKS